MAAPLLAASSRIASRMAQASGAASKAYGAAKSGVKSATGKIGGATQASMNRGANFLGRAMSDPTGAAKSVFTNNTVGSTNLSTGMTSYALNDSALNKLGTIQKSVNTAVNGMAGSLNRGAKGGGSTAMYGTIGDQPGGMYSGGFQSNYKPSLINKVESKGLGGIPEFLDGMSMQAPGFPGSNSGAGGAPWRPGQAAPNTQINRTQLIGSQVFNIPQNPNMTGGAQMPFVPPAQRPQGSPGGPGWGVPLNKPLPNWAVGTLANNPAANRAGAPTSQVTPPPLTPKQQQQVEARRRQTQTEQERTAAQSAAEQAKAQRTKDQEYERRMGESSARTAATAQQGGPASRFVPPNKRTAKDPGASEYLVAKEKATKQDGMSPDEFDRQWMAEQERKQRSAENKAYFAANPMPKKPPRPRAGGNARALGAAAQSAFNEFLGNPNASGSNEATRTPM